MAFFCEIFQLTGQIYCLLPHRFATVYLMLMSNSDGLETILQIAQTEFPK